MFREQGLQMDMSCQSEGCPQTVSLQGPAEDSLVRAFSSPHRAPRSPIRHSHPIRAVIHVQRTAATPGYLLEGRLRAERPACSLEWRSGEVGDVSSREKSRDRSLPSTRGVESMFLGIGKTSHSKCWFKEDEAVARWTADRAPTARTGIDYGIVDSIVFGCKRNDSEREMPEAIPEVKSCRPSISECGIGLTGRNAATSFAVHVDDSAYKDEGKVQGS